MTANITVSAGENLTKLTGNDGMKRAGQFVLDGQTTAGAEGFKNVSKRWYDKTMSFEQGMHALEVGQSKTRDLRASLARMEPTVDALGRFVVKDKEDGREYRPTLYAAGQMGKWAGVGKWFAESLMESPTKPGSDEPLFIRDRGDAETLAMAMLNGLRRLEPSKVFFWRTNEDGTLRAMLSDQYSPVDNRWFLEALSELVPGGRLSHWRGDADTVYGNVLIPDTIREEGDSDYGGMLSVGNSEIGVRRVSSLPSIFRAICMNGCIWGQKKGQGIATFHRGSIDLVELKTSLELNLNAQIPLLPTGVDRLLRTREKRWNGLSVLPLFAELANEYSLTKKQATAVLEAYNEERAITPEYERTLFAAANAFTRAGQKLDNAAWVRFDEIGGELASYDDKDWGRLTSRASELSVKQVEKVFANAV